MNLKAFFKWFKIFFVLENDFKSLILDSSSGD